MSRQLQTLVLLPGNMCDARLWLGDGPVRGLVHHADLGRDHSIAGMAARTLRAVDGPLIACGFSMGAIVAVEMWCQEPERIAGLVLLGYNASADLPERSAQRPRQQAEARQGGLERLLVEELKPNYLAAANRGDAALLALLRGMGLTLGAEVFVRQSHALCTRQDRRGQLPKIDIPVLLGCGREDALCPPEWHQRWAAAIPAARLFVVEGAGHMLPLEAPAVLAEQIFSWLPHERAS
jgi:pimeloyl-ACP methyl ester carboxylesterase